jgi:hypothetical protein
VIGHWWALGPLFEKVESLAAKILCATQNPPPLLFCPRHAYFVNLSSPYTRSVFKSVRRSRINADVDRISLGFADFVKQSCLAENLAVSTPRASCAATERTKNGPTRPIRSVPWVPPSSAFFQTSYSNRDWRADRKSQVIAVWWFLPRQGNRSREGRRRGQAAELCYSQVCPCSVDQERQEGHRFRYANPNSKHPRCRLRSPTEIMRDGRGIED